MMYVKGFLTHLSLAYVIHVLYPTHALKIIPAQPATRFTPFKAQNQFHETYLKS